MKIEIDLNDLGIQYDGDGTPVDRVEIMDLVIKGVTERIYNDVNKDVRSALAELLTETVEAKVHELVEAEVAKPIQESTRWGEPIGDPLTVREMIRRKLEEYLSLGASRRDPYGSRDEKPKSLQDLIARETRDVMTGELSAEITKAKREVVSKVAAVVLESAKERLGK